MSLRMLPAAVIVLAASFAGCIAGDDAPSTSLDPAEHLADEADLTPEEIAERIALEEGHLPHMHDYWNGRSSVMLFDGEVEPTLDDLLVFTAANALFERDYGKVGGAWLIFPDGSTVYEGTGILRLTPTWTDPRVTSLELYYRSGEGPDYHGPVALANGETTELEVTPEMTDLPHMTTSRWSLVFVPGAAPGAVAGPFHLSAEIVKMRDISLFPGHPDGFEGEDVRVLHEAPGRSAQVSYAKRIPNLLLEGEFGEHWITPQTPVPMDTGYLLVEVHVKKAEANVGQVSEIRLYYTTAGSSQPQRAPLLSGSLDEKHLVYGIEVDGGAVDSPYTQESQWRILVEAATTLTDADDRTCGGCVDTDIEFDLLVTAYRAGSEAEATAKSPG